MIAEKFVDLYARNSGLRDKLVAERDVVLTYGLHALRDAGVMDHLAFKGGTCLRKLVFGASGRFSEDLDFTLDTGRADDDVLTEIVDVFNREHYGIRFMFEEYYKTEDDTSFGGDVLYRHEWNDAGRFRLQVSLRERPTLAVVSKAMHHQAYFDHLEFDVFHVRLLEPIELIAEKVRAAFQRTKVRDLYDLHRFSTTPFDAGLLRRLAVLKLMIQDRLAVGGQERLIGAFTAPDGREAADAPNELVGAGWRIAWRARPVAHETSRVDVRAAAEQRPKEPRFRAGCPWNIGLRHVSRLLPSGGALGLQLRLEGREPCGEGGAFVIKLGEAGPFLFDRSPKLIVWSQRSCLSFRGTGRPRGGPSAHPQVKLRNCLTRDIARTSWV